MDNNNLLEQIGNLFTSNTALLRKEMQEMRSELKKETQEVKEELTKVIVTNQEDTIQTLTDIVMRDTINMKKEFK